MATHKVKARRQAELHEAELREEKPSGTIERFIGLLAGKTRKVVTIEEIEEATEQGWGASADAAEG